MVVLGNHILPSWTLRQHGALPRCLLPAPALLKLTFVAAYRYRPAPSAPPNFSAAIALFAPLLSVLILWLIFALPAVFSSTKNQTAAACTLFCSMILATCYTAAVVMVLLFSPGSALFTGTYLAAHFAWFSARVHTDAITGSHLVGYAMSFAVVVILYCAHAWPATELPMPDIAYVAVMWLPDAIARVVHKSMSGVLGALLAHSTCWRLVGDKDD